MSDAVKELLNTQIPDKLWHYTSTRGFQDIVTSKKIFATDVRFLNDREEFTHARKIADEIIQEADEFGSKISCPSASSCRKQSISPSVRVHPIRAACRFS